jgi:hypothetical protein
VEPEDTLGLGLDVDRIDLVVRGVERQLAGLGLGTEDEVDARVDVERLRGARRVHIGVQPAEPVGAVAVPEVPEGQASGVTLAVSLAERQLRVTPSATSQPRRAPAIGAAGNQSKNTTQAAWSG